MRQHHYSSTWRPALFVLLILASSISGLLITAAPPAAPSQLTNEEFWKLSSSLSEVDGEFRSDNLLSNEMGFQYVIPELLRTAQPGRVYMGVGPEQNFTYIAALKPSMAFIVDIRHGNLDVQLLYKALFELSANRSEFVSKLFSRKPMTGFTAQTTAGELFTAYARSEPSKELYDTNLKAIIDHLKTKHGFPLSDGDVDGITWAYSNYYRFGPDISYNSSSSTGNAPAIVGMQANGGRRGGGGGSTYAELMMANDGAGKERSYLANDENFMVLKTLETKNLLVPVIGDFSGPKALREVGKYIKGANAMVSAFYLSNVEQYLTGDKYPTFLTSVSTLPIDGTSRFIRSGSNQGFTGGGGNLGSGLGNMLQESQPYAGK